MRLLQLVLGVALLALLACHPAGPVIDATKQSIDKALSGV